MVGLATAGLLVAAPAWAQTSGSSGSKSGKGYESPGTRNEKGGGLQAPPFSHVLPG